MQLGEMVHDTVTKMDGMLTHLTIDMDLSKRYVFQPKGINPTTGGPVERILIEEKRIKNGKVEEIDIPLEALGTPAEDIATGFKGTITAFVIHMGNCLHVELKPKGTIKSTGATVDAHEFDIRRIKGKHINTLTKKEMKKDIVAKPSPSGTNIRHTGR